MQSNRFAVRSHRRRDRAAVAAAFTAVIVGIVLVPISGHAASTDSPTRTNQQCVIAARAGVPAQRCFATAAEAIAYGSGGQIRIAADATTHDAVVALRTHDATAAHGIVMNKSPRAAMASNIIGIEYDGSYRSGAAKYFSVSGDCYSGAAYGFPRLSTYGWNDRINSAQTFVGCVGQHYDDSYYSDTMVSVFGTKDDFGGQNNKTSSIKFI
jgi:hypothetical protein